MPRLPRNACRLAALLLALPAGLPAQRPVARPAQRVPLPPQQSRTPVPALPGPAAVQVTAAFPTTAMIAFQPVSGATGYTLLRAPTQAGPYAPVTAGVSNPSPTMFKDHGIDPGSTLWYRVAAAYPNGQGVSAPVSVVTPKPTNPNGIQALQTAPAFTTHALPTGAPIPSSIPQMWIVQTTPGTVTLSWNPVPGADFYYVQWENKGIQVAVTPQATITFPEPGSHTFTVQAFFRNEARQVNYGDPTTPAKLTYQLGGIGPSYVRPEVYYGQRYLRINWSTAPTMSNIQVFRTDPGAQLARKPAGGMIFPPTGVYEEREGKFDQVESGKTYTYRVLATAPDGKQWFSPPLPITIPHIAAWTGFVAQSTGSGVVDLSWTAPANVVSYDIWYNEQGYKAGPLVSLPGTATSYRHQGALYSGIVYEYTLFANISNATGPRQMAAVKVK